MLKNKDLRDIEELDVKIAEFVWGDIEFFVRY